MKELTHNELLRHLKIILLPTRPSSPSPNSIIEPQLHRITLRAINDILRRGAIDEDGVMAAVVRTDEDGLTGAVVACYVARRGGKTDARELGEGAGCGWF